MGRLHEILDGVGGELTSNPGGERVQWDLIKFLLGWGQTNIQSSRVNMADLVNLNQGG